MIILPVSEPDYDVLISKRTQFRKYLDGIIERYPELFPVGIKQGFSFSGWVKPTKKVFVKRRRIQIKGDSKEYILHPCFIMPYLRGNTIEISKGLGLRKYNLPYHAIAELLGHDAMFWYRAELSLAYNNIVGTTIKRKNYLPEHIIVDEHHDKLLGQKVYVATTVGQHCFLGASVSPSISYEDLKESYSVFKSEAQQVCPNYNPLTVNIDGFRSTKKTMQKLYPTSTIILCFLHGILKIQSNATKQYDAYLDIVLDKSWGAYQSNNKRCFAQQIRRLEEWTQCYVPQGKFKKAILKLCQKKRLYPIL